MELISKQRQPLPELNALYFLSPFEDSVQALIKDFKDDKKPQYGSAYVYFSAYIRKSYLELFSLIAISSSLESNEGPFHAFFILFWYFFTSRVLSIDSQAGHLGLNLLQLNCFLSQFQQDNDQFG